MINSSILRLVECISRENTHHAQLVRYVAEKYVIPMKLDQLNYVSTFQVLMKRYAALSIQNNNGASTGGVSTASASSSSSSSLDSTSRATEPKQARKPPPGVRSDVDEDESYFSGGNTNDDNDIIMSDDVLARVLEKALPLDQMRMHPHGDGRVNPHGVVDLGDLGDHHIAASDLASDLVEDLAGDLSVDDLTSISSSILSSSASTSSTSSISSTLSENVSEHPTSPDTNNSGTKDDKTDQSVNVNNKSESETDVGKRPLDTEGASEQDDKKRQKVGE